MLMKESNEIFTRNVAEGSNCAMKVLIKIESSKVRRKADEIEHKTKKKQIYCNQSQNQSGSDISAESKKNPIQYWLKWCKYKYVITGQSFADSKTKKNAQFSNFVADSGVLNENHTPNAVLNGVKMLGTMSAFKNWMLMEVIIILFLYRFLISSNDIFMVIGASRSSRLAHSTIQANPATVNKTKLKINLWHVWRIVLILLCHSYFCRDPKWLIARTHFWYNATNGVEWRQNVDTYTLH